MRVHDFKDPDLGKANPYGVHHLAADTGRVTAGTDHDTCAFAVNTIGSWWAAAAGSAAYPQAAYPQAARLLITADGDRSNDYRTRLWMTELAALATQTSLTITVCHLPPGTSARRTRPRCLPRRHQDPRPADASSHHRRDPEPPRLPW